MSAVHKVVKVGDTVADISEGISAGVYTVGIIEGSSELGLTRKEYESLSHVEKIQEQRRVTKVYKDAGADYVIRNMKELLGVLDSIEEKSLKAVVQP